MTHSSVFSWLLLPVLAGGVFLAACDSVDSNQPSVVLDDPILAALSEDLAESVPLGETEIGTVNGVLHHHRRRVLEPGFLWYVAAGLQATMGDEHKNRMLSLLDRVRRPNLLRRAHERLGGPLRLIGDLLTEEQKEALRALHESNRPGVEAIKQAVRNGELDREEARTQMEAIREAMKEAVEALLTDEQRAAIEERMGERKEKRESRREDEIAAMQDALGLSDEQVTGVVRLLEEYGEVRSEWRAGFTEEPFDPETFRSEFAELRSRFWEDLAEVVDEDQLEAMKIHRVLKMRMARMGAGSGSGARQGPPGSGMQRPGPGS